MAKTILSGSYTYVLLTPAAYDNPVTVTGSIIGEQPPGGNYTALIGASRAWSIVNSGVIIGATIDSSGIALNAGGSVTNLSGGTIGGSFAGVYFYGSDVAGSLTNYGSVFSTGSTDYAVKFKFGGVVANASLGVISGAGTGIYLAPNTSGSASVGGTIVTHQSVIKTTFLLYKTARGATGMA